MATLEEVARVIGILKLTYPNFGSRLTEDEWSIMPEVWHRLLHDLPDELIEAAVMHYATSSGSAFPPSVAEIREYAYRLANPRELSAEEAWRCATKYASDGTDGDPLIHEAVRIMGAGHIRMRLDANEATERAHFFRIYETLRKRRQNSIMMLPEIRQLTQRLSVDQSGLALRAGDNARHS